MRCVTAEQGSEAAPLWSALTTRSWDSGSTDTPAPEEERDKGHPSLRRGQFPRPAAPSRLLFPCFS